MTAFLTTVFTAVIALFTYLVWKCYLRIEWLTGAMETHSNLMLMIEASRGINGRPIEMVWWDPSIEDWPSSAQHGAPAEIKTLRIGMPMQLRRNKPTLKRRVIEALRFPDR